MKKIILLMTILGVKSLYAIPLPTNCETPASMGCIYGLTQAIPGCATALAIQNPSGGWGTIAVVEALHNPNAQSDLDVFSNYFSLPSTTLTVYYTPASPAGAPLAAGCANLLPLNMTPPTLCSNDVSSSNNPCDEHVADIEWVHAMAPNANILMFEAPSDNFADKMYAVCYAAFYVAQAGGGLVSMS